MNLHGQKPDWDILRQTQENLNATQKNTELLAAALGQLLGSSAGAERKPKTDEEKRKAAYALNLCTVSVSQIVDYHDLAFLEHEYDAILNNLNLEEMPKDEALLRILKQLLDVITFFRMQEGDKKLLDREYRQRMKDAIWSAAPNFGGVIALDPVSAAISLASQVGIGYMNYRKEKARLGLEQEKAMWQLQRSAMEQFNGLRRELFDTAWRLADEYNFPDRYRITERQITQYNKILMDPDPLRRYERLEYVEDKFVAYPPYWYYRGSAANSVFQNEQYSAELRRTYREKATESFDRFLAYTERNLLREDQLVAACALEYFDLTEDTAKKRALLARAKEASGNAYDVLQLCALSELKLGERNNAKKLLRMLVNEDYNTEVNAQLLSRLYVAEAVQEGGAHWDEANDAYRTLRGRVGDVVLFPMPEQYPRSADETNALGVEFLSRRKAELQDKCVFVLQTMIQTYENRFNALWREPGDITDAVIALMDNMYRAVREISPHANGFLDEIQADKNGNAQTIPFKRCLADDEERKSLSGRAFFEAFTEAAFCALANELVERLKRADNMQKLSELASAFDRLCFREDFFEPQSVRSDVAVRAALLGENHEAVDRQRQKMRACMDVLKNYDTADLLQKAKKKGHAEFLRRDESAFDMYFNDNPNIKGRFYSPRKVFAVLKDTHSSDLHLTTDGIAIIRSLPLGKSVSEFVPYEKIKAGKKDQIKLNRQTYKNDCVNIDKFLDLSQELASTVSRYNTSKKEDALARKVGALIEEADITEDNKRLLGAELVQVLRERL